MTISSFGRSVIPATLLLAATSSQAALVFQPLTDLGLGPGDSYRYAFVTSTGRTATSTDISDYNAFVQSVADASGSLFEGSGVTWRAIASTSTVAAVDNIGGGYDSPIYRIDGQLIAANDTDLWDGEVGVAIDRDETGSEMLIQVWTGTNTDGSIYSAAQLGAGAPRIGVTTVSTAAWISNSFAIGGANGPRLYAISEELAAPASLPATVVLLDSGLLAPAALRRRRQLDWDDKLNFVAHGHC